MNEAVNYQPQRSCGQGNVLQECVCPQGGRVSASVHAGMPDPPDQADTPPRPGRPPPDQADTPPRPGRHTPPDKADTPPDQADTPPREADSSIRSTSGRYASYWNAFLLLGKFV